MAKEVSKERMQKAEKRGRMQHRIYQIVRWEDGAWHIYAPFTQHCISEVLTLREAIQVVEDDIRNQA